MGDVKREIKEIVKSLKQVRKSEMRSGIIALFSGPSGTGKTMAAEVLATEMDKELYAIWGFDMKGKDLAQIFMDNIEISVAVILLFVFFIVFYTRAGISKVSRWRIRLAIIDATNLKKANF